MAVEAAFPGVGSATSEITVAELLIVPALSIRTVMLIVALAPFASVPSEQTTLVVPLQLPWLGVADTNVVPPGSVSVTTTFVTSSRPSFETVMSKVFNLIFRWSDELAKRVPR